MEHKPNSRFFTKKQAFDLMGEKVVKRLDNGRIMPGTEGEVTQVSYRKPREYEVGVTWGDPDPPSSRLRGTTSTPSGNRSYGPGPGI